MAMRAHRGEGQRLWRCPPRTESARKHLEAKGKFCSDIVFYVFVNAFLVIVWVVGGGGYF